MFTAPPPHFMSHPVSVINGIVAGLVVVCYEAYLGTVTGLLCDCCMFGRYH